MTASDLALLKVMPSVGYNTTNCARQNPYMGADAVLACDKNPVVDAPAGKFFHFPTADALAEAYHSILTTFQATSCPGQPPGPDDSLSVGGKEVGRVACFEDKTATPAVPSTVATNNNAAVMEMLNWTYPGGMDALRTWWKRGNGLIQDPPGVDPDFFTEADLDLFKKLSPDEYSNANCRHVDPPPLAKATLACAPNLAKGAPTATFFSFPDRESVQSWYDATVKLAQPHRCDGSPGGSDDPWFRDGKRIGRYTCFTDKDLTRPALVAASTEETFLGVQFTAEAADSPYQLPKDEHALTDWFKQRYTS